MDIEFSCSNCGQHISVDESGAGLTAQCPTCSQNLVVPARTVEALLIPPLTPAVVIPKEVQTNVKQGALIGGCVCFFVAAVCLVAPFPTFFLWMPLALAAFILSIAAMSQGRVAGGLALLLVTIIGVPILWVYGVQQFGKAFSEALKTSTHESTPSLKTASESPTTEKTSVPVRVASQADGFSEQSTAPTAASIPAEAKPSAQEPTALDVKGGFREYRLGIRKSEIPEALTQQHSFAKDAEEYSVENFNHALGTFQIDAIRLEFDHSLGIVKEVSVSVKGKQDVEGVLEAFKIAYGEPEKGGIGDVVYSWRGADIELRYSVDSFLDTTATATWTSKKVDKLIEEDRTRRAKQGATDAAKGL
jgi:hypothetical protein